MSYIYTNYRPAYPNELYHHGIKNQQWGVTNGPPYPLDSAEHRKVIRGEMRAAKKQAKADYKSSKHNVENTAYQVRIARTNADKAAKKYAKSSAKNANERSAKAVDARRTKEFWEKEYANALKTYQEKANAAGKKVKYDGSNRSTVLASTKAGSKGLYALLGGLGGLANAAKMNRMARSIEESKGFNRNLNQQSQKRFAEGKAAAKSEYKTQRLSGPKHTGNNKTNAKAPSSGTGSRSAASEKNAIMKEMTSRFGNSEKNRAALAELKTMLKTTKGEYNKNTKTTTYVTQYGIFDVYPGPNGTMRVAFND